MALPKTESPKAPPPSPAPSSGSYSDYASAAGSGGGSQVTVPVGSNLSAFGISKDFAALKVNWGSAYVGPQYNRTGQDQDVLHGISTPGYTQQITDISPPGYAGPLTNNMLDSLTLWGQLDPMQLRAFQVALYNKGFFGSNRRWANYGTADDASLSAWKKALTQAAKYNKSIFEILGVKDYKELAGSAEGGYKQALASAVASIRGRGAGKAPFQAVVSSPDDLKAVARNVAVNTLGFEPDDDFLDRFAKVYQGMERSAQQRNYAGAGTVVKQPDPSVAAEKQLRAEHKQAADAHDVANQFAQFLQIIGGVAQ